MAPVTEKPVIVKLAFPVLVRVTDCAVLVVLTPWLAKVRLLAERLTAGALPVPVSATVCGLPGSESAMLTEAVRVPEAVGAKVTEIVQLAPCASELPQAFVCEKSAALAPVMLMLLMVKLALPVLLRVTLCAELVVPRF